MCKHNWRTQVELFIEIPFTNMRGVNKAVLRQSNVQILGANWQRATTHCSKCGVWMPGFAPTKVEVVK
jgi:hypothetical protein